MHKISQLTSEREDKDLSRSVRMRGHFGVLGGILAFGLLLNPVQVGSAADTAGQSITLVWDPSPDLAVAGFNIYYGGASGDYTNIVNAGNVTNTTIAGLTAGMIYYCSATAYDAYGDESGYSSEIIFLAPGALPAVRIQSAPAGQFILSVFGVTGKSYDIQATQDLLAWTVIGTMTIDASGSQDFTDTNAANFPQRFYRTSGTP